MLNITKRIRIKDRAHSANVQRALFALGYKWSGHSTELQHTTAPYLYAEDDGKSKYVLHGTCPEYFAQKSCPEYELFYGELVELVEVAPAVKPPLGIRTKDQVAADRKKEILDGIVRYHTAGLEVPNEWLQELVFAR